MPFNESGDCGNGGGLLDQSSEEDLRELKTRVWGLTDWVPKDAYRSRSPGWTVLSSAPTPGSAQEVIPGGWDHDHCDICFWELNASGDPDRASGYWDGEYGWLCRKCHASLMLWSG